MNYRTETIAHELLDFLGIKRGQYIVPELPVGTGTENSLGGCNIYDKDFRFDEEYAYADVVKKDLPKPPVGGARGKKVVIIRNVDHPYHDPFHKMALKCGEFYGMYVCALSGSGSGDKQTAAVKAAIGMKPDLILYMPVDKEKSTEHMKLMYTLEFQCLELMYSRQRKVWQCRYATRGRMNGAWQERLPVKWHMQWVKREGCAL